MEHGMDVNVILMIAHLNSIKQLHYRPLDTIRELFIGILWTATQRTEPID